MCSLLSTVSTLKLLNLSEKWKNDALGMLERKGQGKQDLFCKAETGLKTQFSFSKPS